MADEKDKELNDALLNYLKALGKVGGATAGTDILLGKTDAEQLAELAKLLGERREPGASSALGLLAATGGTLGSTAISEAIKKLLEQDNQKKAAETNVVDSTAANEWLNKHWKTRNCPICGIVTWAMAPQFAHVSFARPGVVGAPPSFPCVVLTCRNCGHTLFFNGVVMGLLPEGTR
ncbi:hypothetical protein [Candidatus Binatus sp.]|uniref:hypothetical protein n=1 Tax=Candidatus Binatus sp. TaxID=2811406 RepID=UPI003C9365C1